MARLPTPGSDAGNWGDILNDFLTQAHNANGTLKDDSVGAAQLVDDAVDTAQLANNSVTSAQLANASVQTIALADSSVTTPKIADSSITSAKIAPGVLPTPGSVADGSVTTVKLADNAVTNAKVDATTRASLTKADSASQPGHTHVIADVASLQTALDSKQATGSYVLTSRKVAGHDLTADVTITPADIGAATAAQGTKADTAVQPGSLATVATTGSYTDLSSKPSLGGAASLNVGTTAGTVAAGDDARIVGAVQGARTVAGHPLTADVVITAADVGAATAAVGALATTAVQPGQLVTLTKKIVSNALIITTTRTFCGKFLPPEPSRGRLIVRNAGANPITFQFGSSLLADFNAPSFSGAPIIAVGQELVVDGSVYGASVAPGADGTEIRALIYREVMI